MAARQRRLRAPEEIQAAATHPPDRSSALGHLLRNGTLAQALLIEERIEPPKIGRKGCRACSNQVEQLRIRFLATQFLAQLGIYLIAMALAHEIRRLVIGRVKYPRCVDCLVCPNIQESKADLLQKVWKVVPWQRMSKSGTGRDEGETI